MLVRQERERQLNFFHLYRSGKPSKPKYPEIERTCGDVFEVINQKWQSLGFEVPTPDNLPLLGTMSPTTEGITINGTGVGIARTHLPWLQESLGDDVLGSTRPTNASVWVHDAVNPQLDTSYVFSLKGELVHFSQTFKPEAKYAKKAYQYEDMELHTDLSFRGKKLYRLWWEVANGTFFPDPRGEMDTIYPHWLRDTGAGRADRKGKPATKEHWEQYLEQIKRGDEVIDPKTGYWETLTERQALNRLRISREYIYNKVPQVFYFRRLPTEPGFIACEGYRARSKKRPSQHYVAKNDCYREFDWDVSKGKINQLLKD